MSYTAACRMWRGASASGNRKADRESCGRGLFLAPCSILAWLAAVDVLCHCSPAFLCYSVGWWVCRMWRGASVCSPGWIRGIVARIWRNACTRCMWRRGGLLATVRNIDRLSYIHINCENKIWFPQETTEIKMNLWLRRWATIHGCRWDKGYTWLP